MLFIWTLILSQSNNWLQYTMVSFNVTGQDDYSREYFQICNAASFDMLQLKYINILLHHSNKPRNKACSKLGIVLLKVYGNRRSGHHNRKLAHYVDMYLR